MLTTKKNDRRARAKAATRGKTARTSRRVKAPARVTFPMIREKADELHAAIKQFERQVNEIIRRADRA